MTVIVGRGGGRVQKADPLAARVWIRSYSKDTPATLPPFQNGR